VCFNYVAKLLRVSGKDIPKQELNFLYFLTYCGNLHLLPNNSVGGSVASDSHRSGERFVLPKQMYGKFGIASTICSLVETSYPEALYCNTEMST